MVLSDQTSPPAFTISPTWPTPGRPQDGHLTHPRPIEASSWDMELDWRSRIVWLLLNATIYKFWTCWWPYSFKWMKESKDLSSVRGKNKVDNKEKREETEKEPSQHSRPMFWFSSRTNFISVLGWQIPSYVCKCMSEGIHPNLLTRVTFGYQV